MNDTYLILINNFHCNLKIGFFDYEKIAHQSVIISLKCSVLKPKIPNIQNVGRYDDIFNFLKTLETMPHVELLETLAQEICRFCLNLDNILNCEVEITKPNILQDQATPSIIWKESRNDH